MQNVSAPPPQGIAKIVACLSMRLGQVHEKFLAQKSDFVWRDRNVSFCQTVYDFLDAQAVDKQSLTHINDDIKTEGAVLRHKGA